MQKIIIASGPVIVENNKVLLDKDFREDLWKFCGGKVTGDDADLISTARNRAKKELGIDIDILDENPFAMYLKREIQGVPTDVLLVHYLSGRKSDIEPGIDTKEWKWFDLDNLPENLGPNIVPALKHFGFIK
jgi:8-oxo-dGTP pyrophosphatase MutT (NUDIX family)